MSTRDEPRDGISSWSRWRYGAVALVVAGVVLPPVSLSAFQSLWPPLVEAIGAAIVATGLTFVGFHAARHQDRKSDIITDGVRRLADRTQRSITQVEAVNNHVVAVEKTVDGERRNLGMVADGLEDLRQIVRLERGNLSLLATGVEDLRTALAAFHETLQASRGEVAKALSRLDEIATQMSVNSKKCDGLQKEIQVERRNLGMVAGALDDLRRMTAGVHLFDARQAAFEDTLIQIADRIDRIGGSSGVALDEPPGPAEQATALSEVALERGDG